MTETHREDRKFTCPICKKPINLSRDFCADEDGKSLHESCYVQQVMSSRNDYPDTLPKEPTFAKDIIDLLNTVSAVCECCKRCSTCGTPMRHRASMFFFGGQTWNVPLAFCPKCNPASEVPSYRA